MPDASKQVAPAVSNLVNVSIFIKLPVKMVKAKDKGKGKNLTKKKSQGRLEFSRREAKGTQVTSIFLKDNY